LAKFNTYSNLIRSNMCTFL